MFQLSARSCSPVMLIDTVKIPGRSAQFVRASLKLSKGQTIPQNTFEGLLEPSNSSAIPKHTMVARSLNTLNDDTSTNVQVINVSLGKVKLSKGTQLGSFTPMCNVYTIDTLCDSDPTSDNTPHVSTLNIDLTLSALSPQEQEQFLGVLQSFHNVFATAEKPLGHTSVVKHHIQTTGPPLRQPMRRIPFSLKDTVNDEVRKMLDSGLICPSNSP